MSKRSALVLILVLALSSLIMVESASAQSIPKPSIPEFTLKYVDSSYDVPPTYGIDPYTGKTVLTQAGYHIQNNSVELIIKNQPYQSYRNENGSLVWLYYVVAVKGHFEKWTYENWASQTIYSKTYDSYPNGYIPSSDSEYTVVTYGLGGDNGTDTAYEYRSPTYNTPFYYGYYDYTLGNISVGGQVDFRVQAIIGYSTRINETFSGPPIGLDPGESYHYYIFTGQTSDSSNSQTVTISDTSNSSSPNPTSPPESTVTPTVTPTTSPTAVSTMPDENTLTLTVPFSAFIAVGAVLAVIIASLALLLYRRRRDTA